MFDRKYIKRASKKSLKTHYWRNVFIAILVSVTSLTLLNNALMSFASSSSDGSLNYGWETIKEIVRFYDSNFLVDLTIPTNILIDAGGGLASSILFSELTFPFYIAYSVLKQIGTSNVNFIWTIIIAILLYVAFVTFILLPLHVGSLRYFVKREDDLEDNTNYVFHGGFNRFYLNIIFSCILRRIYQFLWSLTIVMIPVKHYAYSFVYYIVGDNPTMNPNDVIKLSNTLTKGKKFALFKVDLSFIGYDILNFFTLGLLSVFFIAPYKQITMAKIYLECKNELFEKDPAAYRLYYGTYNVKNEKGLLLRRDVDYDCPYQIVDYILIFFIVGFIGWCWEVGFNFVQTLQWVNRGTLYGPILPIYGTGGIIALVVLKKTRKMPWLSFLLSIVLCLTIEYFTGWYLEVSKGVKYWDYSMMPFNLHGRICLFGGLLFGVGCVAMIYLVGPALYSILSRISPKIKWGVAIFFIACFITDIVVAQFYPRKGEGITDSVSLWYGLYQNLSTILPVLRISA